MIASEEHRKHNGQDRPEEQDDEFETDEEYSSDKGSSLLWTSLKLITAAALCWSAFHMNNSPSTATAAAAAAASPEQSSQNNFPHRRLMEAVRDVPSYMQHLMEDLRAREKLFEDTPPEEVKYWFEYTGPLQVRNERSHSFAYRTKTIERKRERKRAGGYINNCIVHLKTKVTLCLKTLCSIRIAI